LDTPIGAAAIIAAIEASSMEEAPAEAAIGGDDNMIDEPCCSFVILFVNKSRPYTYIACHKGQRQDDRVSGRDQMAKEFGRLPKYGDSIVDELDQHRTTRRR
jgi:hypothetical protein